MFGTQKRQTEEASFDQHAGVHHRQKPDMPSLRHKVRTRHAEKRQRKVLYEHYQLIILVI